MFTVNRLSANEAHHPQTTGHAGHGLGRLADKSRGAIVTQGDNYALNIELFGSPSA
jgi:hypothetical protein